MAEEKDAEAHTTEHIEWTQNSMAQVAHAKSDVFRVLAAQIAGPICPDHILRWEKLEFAPGENVSARSGHIGAVMGDKMVIFGGYCGEKFGDHMFVVDTDPSEDGLYRAQSISSIDKVNKTYRVGHDGVVLPTGTNEKTQTGDTKFSETLYLFGGWNDENYVNNGLLFNLDSLKLVVESTGNHRQLPPPRRDHTLVQMNEHLILFGGWSQTYNGNELWCLNSMWEWDRVELNPDSRPAPCPRRGHTASVINNRMYIIGGLYGFSKYLNDVHIFDLSTHEWTEPIFSGEAPSPRAWHKAVVVGDTQIMVYGGTAGRLTFYHTAYILDTAAMCWFKVDVTGDIPPPRASHSFVLTYLDEALVPDVPFTPRLAGPSDGSSEAAVRIVNSFEDERLVGAVPPPPSSPPPDIETRVRFRALMFGGLTPISAPSADSSGDRSRGDTALSTLTTETDTTASSSNRLAMPSPPIAIGPSGKPRQQTFVSDDSSSQFSMSQRTAEGGSRRELNRIEVSDDFYQLVLETPVD